MKNLFKTLSPKRILTEALSPKRILTDILSPKRIIAGALACIMLGSLLIPAFAEDQPSGGTC